VYILLRKTAFEFTQIVNFNPGDGPRRLVAGPGGGLGRLTD